MIDNLKCNSCSYINIIYYVVLSLLSSPCGVIASMPEVCGLWANIFI